MWPETPRIRRQRAAISPERQRSRSFGDRIGARRLVTTSQTGDPVSTLRKEIEHLRVRLAEAESSLRAFASGEVDTVLQGGAPLLLAKAQESLRESEQRRRLTGSSAAQAEAVGAVAEVRGVHRGADLVCDPA